MSLESWKIKSLRGVCGLALGLSLTVSPSWAAEEATKTDTKEESTEKAPEKPTPEAVAPKAKAQAKAQPKSVKGKKVTTKSGLTYVEMKEGTGDPVKAGTKVTVHYTGWLTKENGKKFDSSVDRGQPFSFNLGASEVIKGWDEGVEGMKVGGTRLLTIPPNLGYGERGAAGVIPPNSVLVFKVELIKIG